MIEPSPRVDERGRFVRAWCTKEFEDHGIQFVPVQANMGLSLRTGTTRGLHYQVAPALEAKLVRCTRGAIFDVVVDLRRGSHTYLKWFGVVLTPENACMLYLPEGCAHGYQTLDAETEMHYMASAFYSPSEAHGVRFDDPTIGIRWPMAASVISDQDKNWPWVESRIEK